MAKAAKVAIAEVIAEQSQAAKRCGFTGKAAIHPKQIDVIVETFSIDPAELDRVFHLSGNGAGTLFRSVPGGRNAESLELLLAERERLVMEQARRFTICAPGSPARSRSAAS